MQRKNMLAKKQQALLVSIKELEDSVAYIDWKQNFHTPCIICSQREPKAWPSMLMEDEVSSNSLLKRVTKHYNVMIEHKVVD